MQSSTWCARAPKLSGSHSDLPYSANWRGWNKRIKHAFSGFPILLKSRSNPLYWENGRNYGQWKNGHWGISTGNLWTNRITNSSESRLKKRTNHTKNVQITFQIKHSEKNVTKINEPAYVIFWRIHSPQSRTAFTFRMLRESGNSDSISRVVGSMHMGRVSLIV